jgi:hypothetical protein
MRQAYVAGESSFLFVIATAESAKAFETYETSFATILGGLRLAKPKEDPALGTMDGNVYVNRKIGCRLELPKGWQPKIAKGKGHFKLSFTSQDGAVKGTLVGLAARKTSVELLVMADEYKTKEIAANYDIIEDGYVHCANAKGYGTVSSFTFAGNPKVRKRAYFRAGGHLFCLLVDVSPARLYRKHALSLETLVKKLTLPAAR